MDRGLRAALSPKEESALQKVALAHPQAAEMRGVDVRRLTSLSLIEERDGKLELTETGVRRREGRCSAKQLPALPGQQRRIPFAQE
jgi:hypothetical protein